MLTAVFGMLLETSILRTLYERDHLSQVLATFALILILNDGVKMIFGNDLPLAMPHALEGPIQILPGLAYSAWRLLIIGVGLLVAVLLYVLVQRTRVGALVRAGASNRGMTQAMGVDVGRLFTAVFGVGAALNGSVSIGLIGLSAIVLGVLWQNVGLALDSWHWYHAGATPDDVGRVQAWTAGSGMGTDDAAACTGVAASRS